MPAPPSLPVNSSWNLSEAAFINYFFNSGCSPCFSCGRSVDNVFPNLTYRIYLCNNKACLGHFMSKKQDNLFTYDPQSTRHRQYEPILPLLLYDTFVDNKVYLSKQAKKELAWYQHLKSLGNEDTLLTRMTEKRRACHALREHAMKMHKWSDHYNRERIVANKKNVVFLMVMMHSAHLNYNIALATPTMRRTLQAFNLRLACLTLTVWRDIRGQVIQEHNELRESKKMSLKMGIKNSQTRDTLAA
ncbi:uncharacterized protein ARMOST_22462 [Armillaria ostoyae]|uniref:Uncharacterized protein n=1 Tax=Armillaria ostoyae TaxID=47428 RepID=A0A284SCY6_ARMOS|nr:uncharacterized protein ARMOST_22462 [Armillaria ostoyae]